MAPFKEMVIEIAFKLRIKGFTASDVSLHHFIKRHDIPCTSIYGEAPGVYAQTVEEWMKNTFPSLIQKKSNKEIFDIIDESELFYNCLPDNNFAEKGEK